MGEPVDIELFAATCDGRGDFGRTARALSDELRSARRCLAAAAEVLTHLGVEFDDARLDYLVAQVDKGDLIRWRTAFSEHRSRAGAGVPSTQSEVSGASRMDQLERLAAVVGAARARSAIEDGEEPVDYLNTHTVSWTPTFTRDEVAAILAALSTERGGDDGK